MVMVSLDIYLCVGGDSVLNTACCLWLLYNLELVVLRVSGDNSKRFIYKQLNTHH